MDIELVKCECCGLKEDCTQDYIAKVKSSFDGKWLCGLCSEAVRDEFNKLAFGLDEAVKAHMSFCRKSRKSNPAIRVADGMREILRRRASDLSANTSSPSSKKKYSRSSSAAAAAGQVENHGSPAIYITSDCHG